MDQQGEPQNQVIMPVQASMPETMVGGMPLPSMPAIITPGERPQLLEDEGLMTGPQVPGGGPVITVRTDDAAMMADGIMPNIRQPRRNPFRGGQMMPTVQRYTPMEGGMPSGITMPSSTSHNQITITKLE